MKTLLVMLQCLALLLPQFCFSQEKIYLDREGNVVTAADDFVSYKELTTQDNGWTYEKSFTDEHQLRSEGAYSTYSEEKKIPEGVHKYYRFADGAFWYLKLYEAGNLVLLESYYPNGKIKRSESHKNGKFEKGECFNEDGSSREFTTFQTPPSFPGGEAKLLQFLADNIQYPLAAIRKNIQGTVAMTFVVEKDGAVTNATVVKDIGKGCGEEALRVVNAMPLWTPGLVDDEPVKVRFTLPVRFRLE